MGADIWLRTPQHTYHFRESYSGTIALSALGLSYWHDLYPRLNDDGTFPIDQNNWLLSELQTRMAERLDGPDALGWATLYLQSTKRGGKGIDPAAAIAYWRDKMTDLADMVIRSAVLDVPLYMSL